MEQSEKGSDDMATTFCCPFYLWEEAGKLKLNCEAGRLRFRSPLSRAEYIRDYCGSAKGYSRCSLAGMLFAAYERTNTDEQC